MCVLHALINLRVAAPLYCSNPIKFSHLELPAVITLHLIGSVVWRLPVLFWFFEGSFTTFFRLFKFCIELLRIDLELLEWFFATKRLLLLQLHWSSDDHLFEILLRFYNILSSAYSFFISLVLSGSGFRILIGLAVGSELSHLLGWHLLSTFCLLHRQGSPIRCKARRTSWFINILARSLIATFLTVDFRVRAWVCPYNCLLQFLHLRNFLHRSQLWWYTISTFEIYTLRGFHRLVERFFTLAHYLVETIGGDRRLIQILFAVLESFFGVACHSPFNLVLAV